MDYILNHTTTSTERIWKALKIHKEKKMQSKEILPGLPGCTPAILIFFFFNLLQLKYRFLNEFEQLAQETF